MTVTLKTRVRALFAFALALALALSFAGCKNFMKSDDDVKKTMEEEVEVANAPVVSVRVQSSAESLGNVTPNGKSNFKLNVGSTVLASETSGGFIKWAAFYSGNPAAEVSNAVTFADPKAKETTAKVLVNRPDIVIKAIFEKRPTSTSHFPSTTSYRNTPIRIVFNKPIDPASLTTTIDGVTVPAITITQDSYGMVDDITTTKYKEPEFNADRTSLTYVLKSDTDDAILPQKGSVTVSIANTLRDASGLTMAEDQSFTFPVGTDVDKDSPVIQKVIGGTTVAYSFPGTEADRRIGKSPIYLQITGGDGEGIVTRAVVTPSLTMYSDAGTMSEPQNYDKKEIPWLSGSLPLGTSFSAAELVKGTGLKDGLITFKVLIYDANLKPSDVYTYRVVRDTTAPSLDPTTQLSRITSSGGTGFYTKTSTVVFSNATPIVDAGYAGGSGVPRLRSATAYYRVTLNPAGFMANPNVDWVAAGSGTSIDIADYTGADSGAVQVYVQLKDDLGNATPIVPLKTIPVDNNAPTGCSIAVTNATAINSLRLINGTTLNYTVKATDAISGVKKYCVKKENAAPSSPAEWIDCGTAPLGPVAITGSIEVDATDGQKTLYAWFQDGAGNVTSSAVTDMVIRDGTRPVIERFYLRSVPGKTNFSSSADTESAAACSNVTSYYFMFVADDTSTGASGFSTFKYADDKGTESVDVTIKNALGAVAGTAPFTVSDVNVAVLTRTPAVNGVPTRVFVTGKLTVTANNDEHALTIVVKDGAGNATLPFTANNRVLFDNMAPATPTVSLAAEAGTYESGTSPIYTNAANRTLSIQSEDTPAGVGAAISGLDKATLTATNGATVPAQAAFSSGTATASITVKPGAANVITVTPWDKAGNAGIPKSVSVALDTTPPTLELYLYSPTETVFGIPNAKVIKAVGSTETVDCSASTNDFKEFYVGMIGYDTGGSGINASAVHAYEVIKRTKGGDSVFASGFLTPTANARITPPVGEFGKSAQWLVRVKAKDNVNNVMTQSGAVGYTYDVTPPTIENDSLIVSFTENGAMQANKVSMPAAFPFYSAGEYYFIPGSALPTDKKVFLRIKATDRPSTDENGSGIYSVSGTFTSWENGKAAVTVRTAEVLTGEPTASYVPVAFDNNKTVSLANVAVMLSAPIVTDKCGNARPGDAFVLAVDDGLPTASYGFSPTNTGKITGVTYLSDDSTMNFTPSDPEATSAVVFYSRASGARGYVLSSSPMPPSLPVSGLGTWTACTNGIAMTVPSTDIASVVGAGTVDLYLHLLDNAGNRNTRGLGKFRIDGTDPTLSGIRVACPTGAVYDVGGIYYISNPDSNPAFDSTFRIYATAVDETNGSGIDSYVVESRAIPVNTADWLLPSSSTNALTTEGEFLVAGDYDSLLSATERQVRIVISDKVGNKAMNAPSIAASTLRIRLDTAKPSAQATLSTCLDSGSNTYISDQTEVSLSLVDPAVEQRVASGIKGWIIQKAGLSAPTKDSAWNPFTGNAATDNGAASVALFDLVSAGSTKVDLYAIDNVDNVSDAWHLNDGDTIMADNVKPSVTITTAVSSNIGADGVYYVSASPVVSFNATDNAGGSGLNKYLYSTETGLVATDIEASGTEYTDPIVGEAVKNGAIDLFDTDNAKTVYLYISDNAGNVERVPLVANASKRDASSPAITRAQAWSETYSQYKTADSDKEMTVRIDYPANAETSSGIKKIRITGDLANPAGIAVLQNGTATLASSFSYDDAASPKVLLITLTTPVRLTSSGYLLVRYMKVTPDLAKYTVTVSDAAGNEAAGTEHTVVSDITAPTGLSETLSDGDNIGIVTHSSLIARVYGSFTESESQLQSITVSGDVSGYDAPTIGVTCGGKTYTESGTEGVNKLTVTWPELVLDPPVASGANVAYEITGIRLSPGTSDGNRTVSLKFTNTADLFASANDVIALDTKPAIPAVWAATGQSCYPTAKIIGSNTEEQTLTLWSKTGESLSLYLYGDDAGSGPAKYQVGTGLPVTNASWGANGLAISVTNTQQVQVWDKVGNRSSITVRVLQDSVAPTFTLSPDEDSGVPATPIAVTDTDLTRSVYTTASKLVFAFSADDNANGSGISMYTLHDVAEDTDETGATIPDTLELDASAGGKAYTLNVTDNIGGSPNVSKKLSLTVYKDNVGPGLTVTPTDPPVSGTSVYPTDAGYGEYFTTGDSMSFTVAATDAAGLGTCSAPGSSSITGTGPYIVTVPSSDAGISVTISVTDALGNPSPSPKTVKVIKDAGKPTLAFKAPSSGILPAGVELGDGDTHVFYTAYADATDTAFALTATDKTLASYKVDSTTTNATAMSGIPVNLAAGTHEITVYDRFGKSAQCSVEIINDATSPDTFAVKPTGTGVYPLTQLSAGGTQQYYSKGAVTFEVTAGDTETGIESCYAISNAPISTVTAAETASPYTLSLAAGKTWTVYAKNKAGVTASAQLTVTVDTTNPTLEVTSPSGTAAYPADTQTTDNKTYYTAGAGITFSVAAYDDHGLIKSISAYNKTTPAETATVAFIAGNAYEVTLGQGKVWVVQATDTFDHQKKFEITVTQDKAPPTIAAGTVSGSGPYSWPITITESPTVPAGLVSSLGSVDYAAPATSGSVSIPSGGGAFKVTVTDSLGNVGGKWLCARSDNVKSSIEVKLPETWTVSSEGGGKYKVSGLSFVCQTYTVTNSGSPVASGSSSGDSISGLTPGSLTLKLNGWNSESIEFTFNLTASAASSPSVLGNPMISARLAPETVNATVRKESFVRARSVSRTNLPVWYSEAVSVNAPVKTERNGSSSANADTPVERDLATQARAGKTVSDEALRAAALLGMKAPKRIATPVADNSVTTEKETVTTVFDAAFVMSAPEGSPAFIAYARGLGALRQDSKGDNALSPGGHDGFVNDREIGRKPEGIWEKLLAFFGVVSK